VPALWLRHESHLAHDVPGHPERPARILALEAEMGRHRWFGCDVREAPAAGREQLTAVHPAHHVTYVEELSVRGGGMIDMDTAVEPGTYEAALHACGAAVAVVDALLGGEARAAVAGTRPPGHHAETARAMGFCFFNNVAVAARRARDAFGIERVLVLDWDVHHGNGTEQIFHSDPGVLVASIHQSPLYPGTGPASDLGSGAARGFNVNLPVPPGSGDETYCSLVAHVVVPLIRGWEPGLVLISAGFDAHVLDPLAQCRVTERGYAAMTASVRAAADAVGAPVGLLLEGGYSVEAMARSMAELVPLLVGRTVPGVQVERHPLAEDAAERLAPWWPSLVAA
jgi:acetoin utilization deacetylase AcuC-like enzyme